VFQEIAPQALNGIIGVVWIENLDKDVHQELYTHTHTNFGDLDSYFNRFVNDLTT
jgi:hypothetical protein